MTSVEWSPIALFRRTREGHGQPLSNFALVILNQSIRDSKILDALWNNSSVRVAADGGANRLRAASKSIEQDNDHSTQYDNLDAIIGDLDSLESEVRQYYSTLPKPVQIVKEEDQESTDFGKAVAWVRANHATPQLDIIALGGLGGRVDQGLSQLHHLYLFQPGPDYQSGRVFLLSNKNLTFLLKAGKHSIRVRDGGEDAFGKHVGIIPVGEPSIITTRGLEWDVENWETRFGGRMSTSNHVLPETQVVHVETTKDVIFTIALAGSL